MTAARHAATTRARRATPAPEPDYSPRLTFPRISAIDMSLTSTGLTTLWVPHHKGALPGEHIRTVAYTTKVPNTATLQQREDRIRYMVDNVTLYLAPADLVIIEGGATGAVGGHAFDRAGAWWQIVRHALATGCTVVVVNPMTRAKWATGNGRADKAAVAAAMTRRMPTITFNNSDEADAAALAYMGAQRLGWRTATKTELAALEPVKWPKGVHA